MAVACDPQSLAIRGDPVVLSDNLEGFAATGMSLFSVLESLLVYSPRTGVAPSRMVWLDRAGKELSTVGPPARFTHLTLSPDGRAAAVTQIEEPLPPDLWIFDTGVGRGIRLTRDQIAQVIPVFSSDGRIFFSAFSTGPWDIWEITPGGRDLKPFLKTRSTKAANDVSPDGRWLLYREFNPGSRGDLKFVPLTGDGRPRTFVATADDESNGDFSPDSRWVAYASDESGRKEIYAASFPDPIRRFRVSSDGGSQPRWSRDGKELFYVRSGQLMAAAVGRQGDDLTFGESRPLFKLPLFTLVDPGFDLATRYDVAPDGRFLALLRAGEEAPTPLVLVQNWVEALKK
jgi:WD40 repeat protein